MADSQALPEGTVTVVFTDVEGSTALRSAVGDDRGHEILADHDDLVRKLLLEHGGTEVKALGDGFLLVFTSTRRAVEFGVGLQSSIERARLGPADRPLRIRIGMHTGEVVARDGDLFGQAVHAAARIQAKAVGGQTLVSDVVKALA
ncbi:MAG: adenylate/guanylate cyclase domain-containing protein, partial [Nitriliruptorales bacterium]|nr:adenylate/guanylate cyclase domain-containing protein [Nitriliruptorales bacterium]